MKVAFSVFTLYHKFTVYVNVNFPGSFADETLPVMLQ